MPRTRETEFIHQIRIDTFFTIFYVFDVTCVRTKLITTHETLIYKILTFYILLKIYPTTNWVLIFIENLSKLIQ